MEGKDHRRTLVVFLQRMLPLTLRRAASFDSRCTTEEIESSMILSRSVADVASVKYNETGLHAVPSTRCHTPICVFVPTDKSNVRQSLFLMSQQVSTNPQFDADGTLKRTPRDVLRAAFRVDAILNRDACLSSASAAFSATSSYLSRTAWCPRPCPGLVS